MVNPASPGGSVGEQALDRMLGTAIWTASRLPYERRIPALGALARFALKRVGRFSERIDANLDYIWPDLPESRRSEIAREVADNAGRVLGEHFSLRDLKQRLHGQCPTGEGLHSVQEATAKGQPILWVSGHYGNYEAAWLILQRLGPPMRALYRPLKNTIINQRYVRAMDAVSQGAMLAQDRSGLVKLSRHLKTGGAAVLLCDLYAGQGCEMEFMGRPAMTAVTASELALHYGALMVPFFGIRHPNGLDFEVAIERPIAPTDPVGMMHAFNESLENRINADPGQWMWMHRRWKRKWNGGKGMVGSLHPAQFPRRKSR